MIFDDPSIENSVALTERLAAMTRDVQRLRQVCRELQREFRRSQELAGRCQETVRQAESMDLAFPFCHDESSPSHSRIAG